MRGYKLRYARFADIPVRRYSMAMLQRALVKLIGEHCDIVLVFPYPQNKPACIRMVYLLPEYRYNRIDFFSYMKGV